MAGDAFEVRQPDQACASLIATMESHSTRCASLIANEVSSVRIDLQHLNNAKVIWVNERAAVLDRPHARGLADDAIYREHLIKACAFTISGSGTPDAYGWADRYGGSGIGRHGGSGRSAIVNGYSVKGIGPTPLLGLGEGLSHSSGGAYLGEAIREILFSRLLQRILPHGASPILAIIDTGLDQTWHLEDRIKLERRVLVVRPFSLRPAHFERAYRYCPGNYAGKRSDNRRVQHNFQIFSEEFGVDGLRAQLETCYLHWAEQIAYGLIHNLALGTSPSNLNTDGAILDFGGVSTLPAMANYITSPGNMVAAEFAKITDSLVELAYSAKEFNANAFGNFDVDLQNSIINTYENRLIIEILSRIGLASCYKYIVDDAPAREKIIRGFLSYYRQAMRLRIDLVASQYDVRHPPVPALESAWSGDRAASLEALASVLNRTFPPTEFERSRQGFKPWRVTRETLREGIDDYITNHAPISDLNSVISHFDTKWT